MQRSKTGSVGRAALRPHVADLLLAEYLPDLPFTAAVVRHPPVHAEYAMEVGGTPASKKRQSAFKIPHACEDYFGFDGMAPGGHIRERNTKTLGRLYR
jgi:hypothetical protein